ncbi:MAG: DUF2088 domain-containing protein [Candidatus Fermentibacteraceae bacterium]|nr:DUF2088 domain-containing protein [Candidatus Fermentibacteraceae bacterium]MBN2608426.1 DUF2088 domain-containing protein [Candidatus Fermentibacteraceae bacterium]
MNGRTGIPDFLRENEIKSDAEPQPLTDRALTEAWEELEPDLRRFSGSGIVTIVVNDATRPPSRPMLEPLESMLDCAVRILFATGTHRPVTEEERTRLIGNCFPDASWKNSDCDLPEMVFIGRTSRGTPVSLDPWILDGGPVIALNSVEPHYFAGFTGGRKSFLPGVASRETIVRNHYQACLSGSEPCRLEGNPVHEDMVEALAMLEARVEIIQGNGVMHRGRLVGFFAGTCTDSFARASESSASLARIPVQERSELVILHPGEPLHINLYQSEKAIYNCSHIVEDGGTLLLVTPCPEGLGAEHLRQAFISSMSEDWKIPDTESYALGDHAIVRLREMRKRLTIALASDLPDDLVREMGMEPVHDVRSWVIARDHTRAVFIPSAGFVVPYLEDS